MSGDSRDERWRLFSPGERLGWEFRDRLRHWRHFPESEPRDVVADPALRTRLDRAIARRRSSLLWAVAGAVIGLLAAWYLANNLVSGGVLANGAGVTAAFLAFLAALWLCVWRPLRLVRAEREARWRLSSVQTTASERHREATGVWRARADAHTAGEWERVNRIPEWGAVRAAAASGRIDVFGGSLRSWEGFLTTFGSSMVTDSPPVRVLDLSEGMVAGELCALARARGVTVAEEVLPGQAAASSLLAGLEADQLTDVLVESIHAGPDGGQREARALDARILGAICRALAPVLSLARVHEALLAVMGEPAASEHLSTAERERVRTELFTADYVRSAHDRFRSLEAQLHPLRDLGSGGAAAQPRDAALHCLAVGGAGAVFATDLFVDLAAQWAIRGLRSGLRPGALIVAGADRLRRRHLERLADACDREGVRLAYLFRHLREDAEDLLGSGGTAVFMRLGNHAEAERAARFIGQGHRFVLSGVTVGHGGDQRHRSGESEGGAIDSSRSQAHWAVTTTRSRTWGTTSSYAEGTNWHFAETRQRVREYVVEPTALQNLPDYALLVVQHGRGFDPGAEQLSGRPRIQVADCNPDIVSLPRVLMEPLPDALSPLAALEEGEPF